MRLSARSKTTKGHRNQLPRSVSKRNRLLATQLVCRAVIEEVVMGHRESELAFESRLFEVAIQAESYK